MTETFTPGGANFVRFMDTFWSYMNKQCWITKTVHILSCSVECQSSNEGEDGLSVISSSQVTQTMTGEQTGTGSEH